MTKLICKWDTYIYIYIYIYRPKEAIKHIKVRLLKKNVRIQLLTLDLLDMMMTYCKLNFHTLVGSKDFMNILVKLIMAKDVPPEVVQRVLFLIQKWAIKFEKYKDILPLFQDVYNGLKAKDLPFPPVSDSHRYVTKY